VFGYRTLAQLRIHDFWGYSSVVKCLPNIYKDLFSTFNT
jgi:hypothetical protein